MNNYYEEEKKRIEAEKGRRAAEEKRIKKRIMGGVLTGVILIGTVVGISTSSEMIKPGYVGIVYSMNGGVQDKVLTQGFKWFAPWKSVQQYSIATEQAYLSKDKKEGPKGDDSFNIPTSDGKTVSVDLEFSYHFDEASLPKTFTTFKGRSGQEIEDTFIRGKMKAWTSEVSSTFSVLDIYGEKRAELNAAVLANVQSKFAPYGIVVDSTNFSRIELDAATSDAIQKRINAQQELEQEKIERDKATIEAEKIKIQAQGVADAAVIKAQGDADANAALSKSITPELLQLKEMEARMAHGWVTIEGAGSVIVDQNK